MPAREYQPGDQVPGTVYKVVRRIGAGGMGTVYDVEDTTIGKRYVLKTLHAQLGAREDLARRMQNEARTLARLHHPNIVEVITAGVTSDALRLPYYLMERLSGQSLRVILEKKGRLELPHAYHIGIDLLDALDHAHDKGVIHRDVKPDNIFLHRTSAGITLTKLLDFGIVSVLDDAGRETAGRFLGTLRYAAPEQLRGDKPTPKTDVYAAALVLYEILAGRGPFDDEGDVQHIARAHLNKRPPAVSRFVPVPPQLDALLSAALAKVPESRPRDAFSFAASLRNLKRLLADPSTEGTENRSTAAAILSPDSQPAPYVDVKRHSPHGPYVVSPASTPSEPKLPRLPSTTMHGMVPPTLGPSPPSSPGLAPTATTPDAVDRLAPTNSIAPARSPAVGSGTEELALLQSAPPPSVPMPWAPERTAIHSDGPQVRSLPVHGVPRRSMGPLIAGALGMVALVVMVGLIVAARRASGRAASARQGAVVDSPLPVAAPEPAVPAPTLAPPALDDPGRAPVRAAASTSRLAPSAVPSRIPSAAPAASKSPKPALTATDRPGPGF